ncbi:hypothetical protein FHW19_004186 [Ochrobactrum anthropi]|uniref:hypothetical protein n=1 Tax=Brucella anthropi TaxID=529 RepID=UPI00180FC742|nr:hypothetical protein [Brucella anthropi]MBA8862440.1 hypothetical protein [Brucella anthropi]
MSSYKSEKAIAPKRGKLWEHSCDAKGCMRGDRSDTRLPMDSFGFAGSISKAAKTLWLATKRRIFRD